jgi:hypothetical protein
MGSRPVPVPIMEELKKYVSGLDAKQQNLFNDYFSRYTWTKIRRKLDLEDYTFHDLRNYADTSIMPSWFPHNGSLGLKMAYITRFNKTYSA